MVKRMVKKIIIGCIIILGMIIFIEVVAHVFGLLGQIVLGAAIFVIPLLYGLTRDF